MPTTFTVTYRLSSSFSKVSLDATRHIIDESLGLHSRASGFYSKIISTKMIGLDGFSYLFEAVFEVRPKEEGRIVDEETALRIAAYVDFPTKRWCVNHDESYRVYIKIDNIKL